MRIERGDKSKGVIYIEERPSLEGQKSKGVIYIEERPSLEGHKSKGVMKKDTVIEIGNA